MLHRNSTRTKEGEILRIILQTFFNLSREDHATVFFLLTLMSAILRVVNHSAKKKKRNIWNLYS